MTGMRRWLLDGEEGGFQGDDAEEAGLVVLGEYDGGGEGAAFEADGGVADLDGAASARRASVCSTMTPSSWSMAAGRAVKLGTMAASSCVSSC